MFLRNGLLPLLVVFASVAQGQAPRVLDAQPSCPKCAIAVTRIAHLTDTIGGYISGGDIQIATDSRGRFWVVDQANVTAVQVFDPQGRRIATIGKAGGGPAEFRRAWALAIGNGDTVHVIDGPARRRSIVSPDSMKVIATSPWIPGSRRDVIVLPSGHSIVAGPIAGRAQVGRPLHEVSVAGDFLRSFGTGEERYLPHMAPLLERRLAQDGHGGFYAVHARRYIIEHWSADGKLIGAWERRADWFPPGIPTVEEPTVEEGLPQKITAVWVDSAGLLWIHAGVRQPDWKRSLQPIQSEGATMLYWKRMEDYWDSVIEVFDLKIGRLVASKRFDAVYPFKAGSGLLATNGKEPDGFIDVWRVRLVKP